MPAERLTLLFQVKDLASAGIRQIRQGLSGLLSPIRSVSSAFLNLRNIVAAAFATLAIRRFVGEIGGLLQAGAEAQRIWTRVEQQIKNVGVAFGDVERKELQTFAERLQQITGISDEEIARVVGLLTSLTGDYRRALEHTNLVLDLAAALQLDYGTAARFVANALQGNITLLARYIPELKTSSDETLKHASAAERAARAISLLRERFGGLAEKEGATLSGQLRLIRELWGDFREELGLAIGTSASGQAAMKSMADAIQGLTQWVRENKEQIGDWVRTIVNATAAVARFVGAIARVGAKIFGLGPNEFAKPLLPQIERADRAELEALRAQLERRISRLSRLLGAPTRLKLEPHELELAGLPPSFQSPVASASLQQRMIERALAGFDLALDAVLRRLRELDQAAQGTSRAFQGVEQSAEGATAGLQAVGQAGGALVAPTRVGPLRVGLQPEPVPFPPLEELLRPRPVRPISAALQPRPEVIDRATVDAMLAAMERQRQASEELAQAKEIERLATAQLIEAMGGAAQALIGIIRGERGGGVLGALGSLAQLAAPVLAAAGLAVPAALLAAGGSLAAALAPRRDDRPVPVFDAAVRQELRELREEIRERLVSVTFTGPERSLNDLRYALDRQTRRDAVPRIP